MEIRTQAQQADDMHENNVVTNGHAGTGGGANYKYHHNKSKSPQVMRHKFLAPSGSNHAGNEDEPRQSDEEEMSQQTQKVMKAFFQSIVSKNGVAERIRRGSRQYFMNNHEQTGFPAASGRSNQMTTKLTTAPPQQPTSTQSDEIILYNVMKGQAPNATRHRPSLSVVSSDSTDSTQCNGRFHRTKSFTKAQMHPVVTEFPNEQQKSTRRSSEDVPQTLPLDLNSSSHDSLGNNENQQTGSPVSHTRASSDPVFVRNDTTGRYKSQNKEKEKKGWFKRFKKKKDNHKIKDDSKDSATSGEGVTTTRRRSPSPSVSPKRTPKIIKKLSSKIKKGGKIDSSSSKTRSRSYDSLEENGLGTTNGDVKSNSLPMEARFSTKPAQSTHRKRKDDRIDGSVVGSDGVPDQGSKRGRKGRRRSVEAQRPTTLDIPKKKSNWKKFKKIFVDSSSSSSATSSPSSSCGDLTKDLPEMFDRGAQRQRRSKHNILPGPDLDREQPSPGSVRGRYQHRATKSMTDMDSPDRDLSEVGIKLMKVLQGYSHIVAQQYAGPAGRTHTPDSYQQHMQKMANRGGRASPSPVKRSSSQAAAIGVKSHSMKAFRNLLEASKAGAESGERRQARRITRDEILHKPSGSFGSPHRGTADGGKQPPQSESHVFAKRQQRKESTAPQQTAASRSHSSIHQSRSSSPRRFSAGPAASASSNLGVPRTGRRHSFHLSVATDSTHSSANHSEHHTYKIEMHTDRTFIARSPHRTREFHRHTDLEIVEADCPPALPVHNTDASDDDMAAAFADGDDVVEIMDVRTERIVVTDEVDGVPAGGTATVARQRSSTAPNLPTYSLDLDELDNDDCALGAVGGADREEKIDVDKLADIIVRALRKKGDELNTGLETRQIDETLTRTFSQLSREMIGDIVERALAKINMTTVSFRHPEIIRLAVGCWLNSTALFNWFIEPIVKSFGGWNATSLISSLDETTQEISSLDKEAPCTSGLNQRNISRRTSESSDSSDGELD